MELMCLELGKKKTVEEDDKGEARERGLHTACRPRKYV